LNGESVAQQTEEQRDRLIGRIIEFGKRLAGPNQIEAACIYGDSRSRLTHPKTVVHALLVIHNFQPRLINYMKTFDGKNVSILAVDEWIFERDIDRGFLGEALTWGLILAYDSIINEEYLHLQEVKLKKRLILELLENLVLDFPELSPEFLIKPQYFVYQAALSRVRLFPPMINDVSDFLRKDARKENVKKALDGYGEALKSLEREGAISFSDSYVRISRNFASSARSPRTRLINLSKALPRALFTSALGAFPRMMDTLSQTRTQPSKPQNSQTTVEAARQTEVPENYVFVPTASGLTSLGSSLDIEATARKLLSLSENEAVEIQPIGGILNDVFLIRASTKSGERKLVAKRFKDWSSFKWFPLALWSLGTRTFSILGRSRLEKECAINRLLHSKGFAVPTLRSVNSKERLILMDYVTGETASRIIKSVAESKRGRSTKKNLKIIERIGRKLAKVHGIGVALGDTKPENILIDKNGSIYLLDFEQASRNGDQAWDIAEFLYYAGHDIPPSAETRTAEIIAETFIAGYLDAGGKAEIVKRAAGPKYTKVFSIFTLPHIMIAISSACKRASP
jgi:tRNA A-37 threonylcarbamoyl transferase component Bud32